MRKREILKQTKHPNGEEYMRIAEYRGGLYEWENPTIYSTFPQSSSRFNKEIALTFFKRPWVAVKRTLIPYWKKDAKA